MLHEKEYREKLQQTLLHLLQHGSNRLDDTCLLKLLDNIRKLCKSADTSHLELFRPFLKGVTVSFTDSAVDVQVKTFAIHLLGILIQDEKAFDHIQTDALWTDFVEKWNDGLICEDLSLLSAMFQCVELVLRHNLGVVWFLHSSIRTGHVDTAFAVLTSGKSLFVISSAEKFLKQLLCRSKNLTAVFTGKQQLEENAVLCDKVQKDIFARLWKMIRTHNEELSHVTPFGNNQCSVTEAGCLAALEILRHYYTECEKEDFTMHRNKIEDLLNQHCLQLPCVTPVLDIVELWYSRIDGSVALELEQGVVSTVQSLMANKQIKSALTLAQRFFFRFSSDNRAVLEEVAFFPMKAVMDNQSSIPLKSELENRKVFTQTLSSAIANIGHLSDEGFTCAVRNNVKILNATAEKAVQCTEIRTKFLQQNAVIQRVSLETVKKCIDRRQPNQVFDVDLLTDICRSLLYLTEESSSSVQSLMLLFKTWISVLSLYSQLQPEFIEISSSGGHNPIDHSKGDNSGIQCLEEPSSNGSDKATCMGNILDRLSFCVEKKMCDLQWEVRDSAVEFITGIINEQDKCLEEWVNCHRLHVSVWRSVRDQESYVRATALKCVTAVVKCDKLRHSLQEHVTTEDMLKKVVEVVETDSEAFPRRAAVDLLSTLYQCVSADHQQLILKTLQSVATSDFDWDVQLNALKFWEVFVETNLSYLENSKRTVPEYAVMCNTEQGTKRKSEQDCDTSLMKTLDQSGVCSVLLTALDDCEPSVQERACHILISMRNKLAGLISDQIIDGAKKLKWDTSDPKTLCDSESSLNVRERDSEGNSDHCKSVGSFISVLKDLDLEEKLATLHQSPYEDYEKNPMSVLEDILASLTDAQNEDNAIDCY